MRSLSCWWVLFGIAMGCALVGAPARAEPPSAPAGPYRVAVERIIQNFTATVRQSPGQEAVQNSQQSVRLFLVVTPPEGGSVAGVEEISNPVVGRSDTGRAIVFRGYTTPVADPVRAAVWRTSLNAAEVDLTATRLDTLAGELVVFPEASLMRMEFPVAGPFPLTREEKGVRVTLQSAKISGSRLQAQFATEWASQLSVNPLGLGSLSGLYARGGEGVNHAPDGGTTSTSVIDGTDRRMMSVYFDTRRETPTQLVFTAIVRSGEPRRLPFVIANLVLPDRLPAELVMPTPPLLEAANGEALGALRFSVRATGRPVSDGVMLVGIARRVGDRWGPWRWTEAPIRGGEVRLPGVPAGVYRVMRRWTPPAPATGAAAVQILSGEVRVPAGAILELPPLELPAEAAR